MTDAGWQVRWERGTEGPHRVGTVPPEERSVLPGDEQVTVLFLLGRGDSLELRSGVARRLASSGARVVAVEHVGQGASPGLGARPDSVHVRDFRTHVRAGLAEADRLQGRAVLLGHSMGGLVALHLLAARPDRFAAAVLTSPMWGWAGGLPPRLASAVASLAVRAGRATALAAGERGFSTASCLRMRGAADDQAPFLLQLAGQHPDLVRGGSTWGWALAASRSMQQLPYLPLQRVRTSVTVVSCAGDRTVSLAAHQRVARRLDGARVVRLASGHDPFVGEDAARTQLWDEIARAVRLAGRGPGTD